MLHISETIRLRNRNKQSSDELDYYTDFEDLEVNLNQDEPHDLYDSSDDNIDERDHLDIAQWCRDFETTEPINDNLFDYLEG